MSDSVQSHRRQPTGLPCPWDSPGNNTGVGCHFLLQCMKLKSESEVAQSCLTLHDPMDCSSPGSSVHGILQARVLEWVAIAFSTMIFIRECSAYVFLWELKDTCTPMFSATLFTMAKTWKQPKCLLKEEWKRKMQYTYTMGY